MRADALSGGMKRRLQVALALLGSSRVILLGTSRSTTTQSLPSNAAPGCVSAAGNIMSCLRQSGHGGSCITHEGCFYRAPAGQEL